VSLFRAFTTMLEKVLLSKALFALLIGLPGLLTFQLPFGLVLVPEILQKSRLVETVNGILLRDRSGIVTEIACANVSDVATVSACFDARLYSYGFCPGDVIAEMYAAFGIVFTQNGDKLMTGTWDMPRLNTFNASWNPSLLDATIQWCSARHFYDPEKSGSFWYNKDDVLNDVNWALIFLLGGGLGLLLLSSVCFEIGILMLFVCAVVALCCRCTEWMSRKDKDEFPPPAYVEEMK